MHRSLALLSLVAACAACSHFEESYVVKIRTGSYGEQLEPPQFYRFDLQGCSTLQRTEFQCGWYDKDAVDQLFSEVVTETSVRDVETGGAQAPTVAVKKLSAATYGKGPYEIIGPGGETFDATNRRFVMIAANNPKVVAQQISALANNKELAGAFASVAQASQRLANRKAKSVRDREVQAHGGVLDALTTADAALADALKRVTAHENPAGGAAATPLPTPAEIDETLRKVLDALPATK